MGRSKGRRDHREAVIERELRRIGQRHCEGCGQKLRGFHQFHGGTVQIERSGADGTVMLVTLPRDGKES